MIRTILVALVRAVTGVNPRWLSEPAQTGQSIYFANHTSHLDAVVLWASLPPLLRNKTRPVAARDYWERTALRRYFATNVFHAVLIDRTRVSVENNPVKIMTDAMGSEHSLIIFPEGSRGEGDEPGTFKSGLFHLAKARPDAVLIPAHLENLNRVLPKGEFLPVPLLSSVTFGPPLPRLENETKGAFLERARQAVSQLKQHE